MLVVVVALALSAIVPALASARVTWATNYVPVSKSTASEWSGKLAISNSNAKYTVECTEKAEGTVGANGTGEITKMTASSCKNIKGCGTPDTITALNLPWHTELVSSGGTLKNVITGGGKGNPAFKTLCTIIIKVEEECTASSLSTTATNGELGVTATFNGENLSCTDGGAGVGKVEGTQTVTALGGTLSAQKEEPVWLKEGVPIEGAAKSTEWSKGTITVRVPGGGGMFGVRCEDSGQGTAAAAGAGTITKFTMTKCERDPEESVCDGAYSLEATNLPWNTELYFGSGTLVGDAYKEDGAGVPKIKLKCEWGSKGAGTGEREFAGMGLIANNTERGVFAELDERVLESTQTINLTSLETLHVS